MAVSLSGLKRKQIKRSIADQLAKQTQGLQEVPWWETVGNIALPLVATMLMPGVGGLLASMGGGLGALTGGVLGGGLTAAGGGLASVGAVGSGLGGVAKTLGSTGMKALYNIGAQEAKKGLYKGLDKRSEKDIKVKGGPLAQLLGKRAETQLRKDWLDAQSAMDQTNLVAALTGAVASQGAGAFEDMFKGLFTKGDTSFLEGLQSVEGAQQAVDIANIMGQQASPLAKIASGNQLITDASQRVGGQSALEKLFQEQMDLSQYGAISDGVGGKGSMLSELLKLNRTY